MKTDIVLISGKQGSGKTTLAEEIKKAIEERSCGYSWVLCTDLIFAGPIYEMHNFCRSVLVNAGVDPAHKHKDGNLLQLLGTEWGRNTIDQNVWVKVIKGRIENHRRVAEDLGVERLTIVIPDLRFKNEFEAFPEALRVRLECPEAIRKSRIESGNSMWRDNTNHPSETDLDQYSSMELFDLYFDTGIFSPRTCADSVVRELLFGGWKERREKMGVEV